mmetsp:Transcript_60771/g.131585  ORF Transcript_60771/g.131585 Transcript_60771/m.131585 type:complete len:316 (+) Transcript_60771:204-1151(+)
MCVRAPRTAHPLRTGGFVCSAHTIRPRRRLRRRSSRVHLHRIAVLLLGLGGRLVLLLGRGLVGRQLQVVGQDAALEGALEARHLLDGLGLHDGLLDALDDLRRGPGLGRVDGHPLHLLVHDARRRDLLHKLLAAVASEQEAGGLALLVLDAAEVQDAQRLGALVDHVGPVVLHLRHGVLQQAEVLEVLELGQGLEVHQLLQLVPGEDHGAQVRHRLEAVLGYAADAVAHEEQDAEPLQGREVPKLDQVVVAKVDALVSVIRAAQVLDGRDLQATQQELALLRRIETLRRLLDQLQGEPHGGNRGLMPLLPSRPNS